MAPMEEITVLPTIFSRKIVEQNVVNSIDGANALKLDESLEIKNDEEQNALIDSFENNEEKEIVANSLNNIRKNDEIPSGVSMESAAYIEQSSKIEKEDNKLNISTEIKQNSEEEYTPRLFAEEKAQEDAVNIDEQGESREDQLFDQDTNEDEDFEIPAFLRRQKF